MFVSFKKLICLLIIVLSISISLSAKGGIDIYVSDIIVNSSKEEYKSFDISPILTQSLLSVSSKSFTFHSFSEIVSKESIIMREKIKNDYMAYEVCDILGIRYLIYGFISAENNNMIADIRLFSKVENKTILTINVEKKNETDLSRFIEEMILEVDNQINKDIKLKDNEIVVQDIKGDGKTEIDGTENNKKKKVIILDTKEKDKKIYVSNYIGIYNSVGYPFPIDNWWNILTGMINVETGVKIVRIKPFYDNKKVALYLKPALLFSYSLYVNKPKLSESLLNSFIFKAPLDFDVKLFNRFEIFVGLGPQVQMDLFTQKYLDKYTNYFGVAFSLFASTGIEYFLDKRQLVSIGLNNNFDFTFYDRFFINYKLQFYTMVKFQEKK